MFESRIPAIETVGLTKNYGPVQSLKGLDLRVPAGSIFGFLGRNGAGKTTTVKILLGMARAGSGQARVFGIDATHSAGSLEIRRRTAFVSEEKDLYESLTVAETMAFTKSFYPKWRDDLAARYQRLFELPGDRKVKALSKGMRTKLALLTAFARGAELLILDEPTSGLDPAVTEQVLQAVVHHVANEESTIFFSSHNIAEVDQVADHLAIIDDGRAVLSGACDDMRAQYRRWQLVFDGDAPDFHADWAGVIGWRRQGRMLTLLTADASGELDARMRGLRPTSMEAFPLSLKEIFLETTRKPESAQKEEFTHV